MQGIVKFRLVDWIQSIDDQFAPSGKRGVIRYASHGQTVSTATSGDDPNVIYGLPEADFHRLDELGAFFSEGEVQAMEAGVSDVGAAESTDSLRDPRGDVVTSPWSAGVGNDPGAAASGRHPLSFDEMTPLQMADYFIQVEADVDDVVSFIKMHPYLADKAGAAASLLPAALAARGYEVPEEIHEAVAKAKGTQLRGPEGSDGVPGTDESATAAGTGAEAPESDDDLGGSYPDDEEGGDAEGYTPEAKQLADENDIAIADVEGTGQDGKVLKKDVARHIKDLNEKKE